MLSLACKPHPEKYNSSGLKKITTTTTVQTHSSLSPKFFKDKKHTRALLKVYSEIQQHHTAVVTVSKNESLRKTRQRVTVNQRRAARTSSPRGAHLSPPADAAAPLRAREWVKHRHLRCSGCSVSARLNAALFVTSRGICFYYPQPQFGFYY